MANKSKSSRRWLQEHFSDTYVKKAQQSGLKSRAVFKLQELQDKDRLFKPGMLVIDLGAAPGSWSEYVAKIIGKHGKVFALDLLPMNLTGENIECIQGDFREEAILQNLLTRLGPKKADWVLSDMAPNLSGLDAVDQPRAMELVELAFELAKDVLNEQGGFLVKLFQGEGSEHFILQLRQHFKRVVIRKPKASRDRSREVYVLAREFKK